MHFPCHCGAMLALLAPEGCEQLIVLHPKGVVADGYRSSNRRAYFEPSFVECSKIELVTWSIPLLTIMLLGSVARIGPHELDPAKPLSRL